ncbi:MAG TPA: recombinase family protein [Bacteriovoracaceae bacterium]|nr:recombinase family protein [Bacteriovoracaceae bacterium]
MRVLCYARVSTTHHDQKPEIQINEMRRYCHDRGWVIQEEIVDHGYSGGTDSRPGLKKMLMMVKNKEVDTIVVLKLDRLFRSLRHLVTTLDDWQDKGIGFIAIKDQVDYTTSTGRFFVQLLGCLGEFEKSLLRERTMLGLEHARSKGIKLGRKKLRDDVAIHSLRKEGKSIREIARNLKISTTAVQRGLKSFQSDLTPSSS